MRTILRFSFFLILVSPTVWGQVFLIGKLDSTGTGSGSTAKGTVWAVLSSDMSTLTYSVTYNRLGSAYTNSHFHHSGGVQGITFGSSNTATGTWTNLTDNNVRDLLRGTVYVNIHSSNFPNGEIRGFLNVAPGIGLSIKLDGAQAGTASNGKGTGWVYLDSSSARATWHITYSGMTSIITNSHFHYAGTVKGITFADSVSTGTWSPLPDSITRMFVKGGVYANIHSAFAPGGEIRGTVKLGSGITTSVQRFSDAIPAAFQLEQNYPNPFNPSTAIAFDIKMTAHVSLKIYNLLGQEVATLVNEVKQPGSYVATFNAGALTTGVYFYRLSADNFVETRKMVLLK